MPILLRKINILITLGFILLIFSIILVNTEDWNARIFFLLLLAWFLFLDFGTNVSLKRKILPSGKFCDNCGAMIWKRNITFGDDEHCWRCQSFIKK